MNPLLQAGLVVFGGIAAVALALAGIAAPFQFRDFSVPMLKWAACALGLALLWALLLFVAQLGL